MSTTLEHRASREETPRTPSFKEKPDDEKAQAHDVDVDIAQITGAAFDDPNLDKDHLYLNEDDSPYPGTIR